MQRRANIALLCFCELALLATVLVLLNCGGGAPTASGQGSFGMTTVQSEYAGEAAIESVAFDQGSVAAGSTLTATITLTHPAPAGGAVVQLASSDSATLPLPAIVRIAGGQDAAMVEVTTKPASLTTPVTMTASYANARVGTTVRVLSGGAMPEGASEQTALSAALQAKSDNPGATFKACMYKIKANSYQAVEIAVKNPGTYPFNAVLYSGTTCKTFADQFGFGQELSLGAADYIFWFSAFKNKRDMSAIWYLGDQKSGCVKYPTAPVC